MQHVMVSSQRAVAGREETYQWRQSNWFLEKLEGTADSRACVVGAVVHQRHGATTHVPGRPTGPLSGAVSCLRPVVCSSVPSRFDLLLVKSSSGVPGTIFFLRPVPEYVFVNIFIARFS